MEEEKKHYDEYEIDLREYIFLLWENKWFIIGLFFIAILGALLFSQFYLSPVYKTEAIIQLSNIDNLYSDSDSVRQIMKSNRLVNPIMDKYDQEYSDAQLNSYIENNIKVSEINNGQIRLSVKNGNPNLTLNITNDIINDFLEQAEESYKKYISRKEKNIKDLKSQIEKIDKRILSVNKGIDKLKESNFEPAEKSILINEQVNLLELLYNQKSDYQEKVRELENEVSGFYSLEVLNEAYLPENPISPNTKLNVAIAGVLAIMLGVFIVFFREFLKEDENKEIQA